jgi:hypothetical protein
MPQHQRAFALEEHRLRQRREQLGPARQRVVAHAHDGHRRHRRFGQRREHRRGHARGCAFGFGAAGFEQRDLATRLRERDRHQAAHEARAETAAD